MLDLKEKRNKGEHVDTKNINKHKNDVFRLSQLITGANSVVLSETIKADMSAFIEAMFKEDVDLKNLEIKEKKEDILKRLAAVYEIEL